MAKVFSLFLGVLAFSSLVNANQGRLDGAWSGQAEYTNTWESGAIATDLKLSFLDDAESLNFALQFTYPDGQDIQQVLKFVIDGTDLLYNGQVVGMVTADKLMINEAFLGADTYSASFEINADGTGTYSDIYCYGQKRDGDCEFLKGTLDQRSVRKIFSRFGEKSQR